MNDTETELYQLRSRVGELETQISSYHEMLEGHLQWQAERVVIEAISWFRLIIYGASFFAGIMVSRWIDADVWYIDVPAFMVPWFAVLIIGGLWTEKVKEEEIAKLPRPWKFTRKPRWQRVDD